MSRYEFEEILDICTFSELMQDKIIIPGMLEQIAYMAKNPDPGSIFDKATKDIQSLPNQKLLEELLKRNYDTLIGTLLGQTELVGAAAYQIHTEEESTDWHMFKLFVNPKYRGHHYGTAMGVYLIQRAQKEGADRIKFGQGRHPAVVNILRSLHRNEEKLKVKIDPQTYWINL